MKTILLTLTSRLSTTNKTILIAGAGDLGLRLARRLAPTYQMVAVRRFFVHTVTDQGIAEYPFDRDWSKLISKYQPSIIVICWAPSERGIEAYRALYLDELERLLHAAKTISSPYILQVSSSAVWECENGSVIQDHDPQPPTLEERSKILLKAEEMVHAHVEQKTGLACTLRLSGLYGPQRWPGLRLLRNNKPIDKHPEGWVNLIHVEDACEACAKAIEQQRQGIFLVSSEFIQRKTLYHFAHQHFQTPPPQWSGNSSQLGKRICSQTFKDVTGWEPIFPSVCGWLEIQDLEN